MKTFVSRIAAALFVCTLAACSAEVSSPPPAAETAPVEEQAPGAAPPPAETTPAQPEPPPAATGPAPPQEQAQPAPTDQVQAERPSIVAPTPEERARVVERGPTAAPSRPPAGARAPSSTGTAIPRMQNRVLTPVLVELLAAEARTARQGGSAVVLLGDPTIQLLAQRNAALCRSLFQTFDQATTSEVQVGVRRDEEGEVQLLRPIYWLTRAVTPGQPGADRCPQRLEGYDYARSERIKRKFRLMGAGPYLVVERNDQSQTERVAAVIDLSRTRAADVPQMVRYFRDGFIQRGDIWNPAVYTPEQTRGSLTAFFGQSVNYGVLPRLVRVTQQVGCPLANLFDVCAGPA